MKRPILTILALGAALTPARAATVELWAVFNQTPPEDGFSMIGIPLSTGPWRVGSAGGPVASNALVSQVLGNLTDLRVGGLGNAVILGALTQGYEFAITNPTLGGVSEDFSGGFGSDGFGFFGPVGGGGFSPVGGDPGGTISVLSFATDPETLIGFRFPSRFLGNQSAALGSNITFRWATKAASFSVVNPEYVFEKGGRVILTGEIEDGEVPEPGTLVSAASALVLAAFVAARRRQRIG
jgi:hypothetical protein